MIKRVLKKLLMQVTDACLALKPAEAVAAIVAARYECFVRQRAERRAREYLIESGDDSIRSGPFRGMQYAHDVCGNGAWIPRILGTYEAELHHALEQICHKQYETIINVGAAEGYYSVGLLRRIPCAIGIAYETDSSLRNRCEQMAAINGVSDRLDVLGRCDVADFKRSVQETSGLLVLDCSGFEFEILKPDEIPELSKFDILLELHDFDSTGRTVAEWVASTFSESHSVHFVNRRFLRPVDQICLPNLKPWEVKWVATEGRQYSAGWAFLQARLSAENDASSRCYQVSSTER